GLIDWSKPAHVVCRQVRAMQPWPTAYTFLHRTGKPPLRVIIHRAETGALTMCGPNRPLSGTISGAGKDIDSGRFLIAIWPGNNIDVSVSELQPAGKKRMTAEEFLRGYPLTEGDRFGPEQV